MSVCSPGKVIVATNKGVYILVPLPLEKQIQDLLASHRVEEALVLAKGARRNIPKEKFQVCRYLNFHDNVSLQWDHVCQWPNDHWVGWARNLH